MNQSKRQEVQSRTPRHAERGHVEHYWDRESHDRDVAQEVEELRENAKRLAHRDERHAA